MAENASPSQKEKYVKPSNMPIDRLLCNINKKAISAMEHGKRTDPDVSNLENVGYSGVSFCEAADLNTNTRSE